MLLNYVFYFFDIISDLKFIMLGAVVKRYPGL